MGIYYYKLFDLMNRKGLKKGDLMEMAQISSATMAKLSKNKVMQTDIIERMCKALDCQPGDIMERIPDEDEAYFFRDRFVFEQFYARMMKGVMHPAYLR